MNSERSETTPRESHKQLSLAQAAAHCRFLEATFVKWVRCGLLPAGRNKTWDMQSLDSVLSTLLASGVPGNQKIRDAQRYPYLQHIPRQRVADPRRHHYYFRPSREKLPGPLGSPEFMKALIECEQRRYERSPHAVESPHDDFHLLETNQTSASSGKQSNSDKLKPTRPVLLAVTTDTLFLTPEELVARWRWELSVETLSNWRFKRIGPGYVRAGKAILYPVSELERWERANLIMCDR